MGRIFTGTCGYDYLDWKGTFYPSQLEREAWLGCCAEQFGALELGSFFLRHPESQAVESLVRQAGDRLVFTVKVHRSLTHDIDEGQWRISARRFREGLTPLIESGRLGSLLFVFPKPFIHDGPRRLYLGELLDFFGDLPKTVEFRHEGWLTDRVFEGLRQRSTAWCSVDGPPVEGVPPPCDIPTAPWAYFRFHGRHEAGWWGSGASARYNYDYQKKEGELEGLAARVRVMAGQVDRTFVFFNNHPAGQAGRNAVAFRALETGDGSGG